MKPFPKLHVALLLGYVAITGCNESGRGGEVPYERLLAARDDSANWLMYSGAYDGQRHSRLQEINRETVGGLVRVWDHLTDTAHPVETTPLVVDGTMFFTRPPNDIVALDAATGSLRWEFRWPAPDGQRLCCGRVNRGLAILGRTLFMATLDAHLVAIDATTGQKRWSVPVGDWRTGFSITSAPLAIKDMVLTGSSLGQDYLEGLTPGQIPVLRGHVDAYDAATGALRWRFHTIPVREERGSETWKDGTWWVGGGATWMTGSFDPDLNLVYWGVGAPNAPQFERFRPGDNLYTGSVVALDADSGTLRWHYQFTPHDSHDWDAAHIMVLANLEIDGARRALLLNANRNGFYYALDRKTGAFLRATAFAEQSWADSIDSTGRPRVRGNIVPTHRGNEVAPSQDGATSWWSPAFNPALSLFYVTAHDARETYFTTDLPAVLDSGARERVLHDIRRRFDPSTVVSAVRALDATTGAVRWEHRLPLRSTAGLLTTAGSVVFTGTTTGEALALDAASGSVLWQATIGGWIHSAPITYRAGGRQLVTIASSNGLFTFAVSARGR